jgi:predicted outer membrane repeat protein
MVDERNFIGVVQGGSATNLPCTGWAEIDFVPGPTLSGGCGLLVDRTPSVTITATPSLTVTSGGSVTLTASGATSYTWSTGESTTAITVSPVTSATAFSVTGVTGGCSGTASAAVSVTTLTFCNTTAYVTPAGNGTKDGSSWANALPGDEFPQALATACSGTTFLVGAGLYKPTTSTIDRTATFRIPSGVEVYGGYTVVGGVATGRVISTSTGTPSSTTFSGDIDGNNTLDGTNSYNVVSLSNVSASTRLDGLVITGGYADGSSAPYNRGGGVYNVASGLGNSSNPTLTNCLFEANFGRGGGLYSLANEGTTASPTISNCRFANNLALNRRQGAAIAVSSYGSPTNRATANPVITNTVFAQNTSTTGGALTADTDYGDIRPWFTNCHFTGNTATSVGGAMNWYGYTGIISVTALNCQFTDNRAGLGGAVYMDGSYGFENGAGAGIANVVTLVFQNSTFTGNSATDDGGALYVNGSYTGMAEINLTNCVVSNNSATTGGGIYADATESGTALVGITGSAFTNNRSLGDGGTIPGNGGAIYSLSAVAGVQSSTFTGNSAGGNGGAIYDSGSSLTLTSLLVNQNTAVAGSGGGIYSEGPVSLTLTNVNVLQNVSRASGGGIHTKSSIILTGCQVSQNTANSNAGGIIADANSATLVSITSSTLNQNVSSSSGGALYHAASGASIMLTNVQMNENRSSSSGGAIHIEESDVTATLNDVQMDDNVSTNSNAGSLYFNGSASPLRMTNVRMRRNRSRLSGGAVYADGPVTLTNCDISQNTCGSGNAGAVYMNSGNSLSVTSSTISQNQSPSSGGAIYANRSTTATLNDVLMDDNVSTNANAGSLYFSRSDSPLSMTQVRMRRNRSSSSGGAVYAEGPVTLTNCDISQNTCGSGNAGAVYMNSGNSFSVTSSTISQNQSPSSGGAIYVSSSATATLNDVLMDDNISATGNAGALYFSASNSPLRMTQVRMRRNRSSSSGGAVYINGPATITNCDISQNTATGSGGGAISMGTSTTVTLVNCTLNRNAAGSGSTVFSGGIFVVQNSIIWNNAPVSNIFAGLAQSAITLQNSLIDPTVTGYTDGGNNRTANPLFTDEAANDLTLTGCSPAVNAGDNALYTAANGPATDVVGAPRPSNSTVDMGAYEFQGAPGSLTVTVTGLPSLTITRGSSVTLTAAGGADTYRWSNGSTGNLLVLTNVTSATTLSLTGVTGGCSGTATVTVSLLPCSVTAVVSPRASTICAGQSTTLTASGGTGYQWANGPATASYLVRPLTTTTYSVTVTNTATGCSSATTMTVTVNPAITATIGGNQVLSCGQSLTLTASSNGTNYTWSANTGGVTSAQVVVRPGQTGTVYSVTVTNPGTGCGGVASVTATLAPTMAAQAISTTVMSELSASNCPVLIQSTGTGNAFVFTNPVTGTVYSTVYRNGGTYNLPAVPVKQPGTYTMTAYYTDACGTTSTDSRTFVVTGTGCN